MNQAHAQNDSSSQQPQEKRTEQIPVIEKKVADPIVVTKDSTPSNLIIADTIQQAFIVDSLRKDSVQRAALLILEMAKPDTVTYNKYYDHPFLSFNRPAIYLMMPERKPTDKDVLFYILTGLVAFLALVRFIFPKYFRNLFLSFLQTSVRQKQTREQLLQNNMASVLLNVLFFASGGIYIALLVVYKQWITIPFYQLILYCSTLLLIIYLGKYLFLLFSGWVFNVPEATGSYSFVVFLVNKVLGVALIPFLWVLTFSSDAIMQTALTISIGLVALLFVYRYLVSFGAIRSNLKVSAFHFFLYLCAVELLPLLLMYKLLLKYIAGSI